MSFLLDTNVVSEWVKPLPDLGVSKWLASVVEDRVFVSVITLAELRYGVDRLRPGRRRNRLEIWLREQLPQRFDGRILPVTDVIAGAWGKIVAAREARGRPIGAMDAFLAATCEVHELALVTRNASDFDGVSEAVIDPWSRDP